MLCCTFFGHHDCPASIKHKLRATLVNLIEKQGVDRFYVGRQGAFDAMVYSLLRELAETYPHIWYAAVLERLPGQGVEADHTLFPEGQEAVPPRWAIPRRNAWMLKQADYVVVYIVHSWGGAARFATQALRWKKEVINLAAFPMQQNNL